VETYNNKDAGGGKTLTPSITVKDGGNSDMTGNYNVTLVNDTNGVINKANLAVTANNYSKTCDGIAYSGGAGVTYNGFVGSENASVLSGALTYSGASQGAIIPGVYTIIPGGFTALNYNIGYEQGTLKISNIISGNPVVTASTEGMMNSLRGEKTLGVALATFYNPTGGDLAMASKQAAIMQQHEQRTALYREALNELKNNPEAADVPRCSGGGSGSDAACLSSGAEVQSAIEEMAKKNAQAAQVALTAKSKKNRRLAVLIGNNTYQDPIPTLETPVSDVEETAKLLKEKFGFETRVLLNGGKKQIFQTLNQLITDTSPDDSILLFYAGHGYLVEDTGMGYWIPSDGSVKTPKNWISNSDIAKLLQAIPAKQVILLSDSCYSGSLVKELRVKSNRHFKKTQKEEVKALRSVMTFSSGGEEPVSDEGRGGHSIFAWNLIKALEGVDEASNGYEIYNEVANGVKQSHPQSPQYGAVLTAGHMAGGEFIFEPAK
jgi:hypothetical protein